jgi:hypothetical protein
MPAAIAVPLIASAISAGGGIAAAQLSKSKSSTTPTAAPEYQTLQSMLVNRIQDRLQNPSSLPSGYETGQIKGINNTYDLIGQSQANNLTARGLGTSPVAGAVDARRDQSRAGQIATMQASLPLLERQLQTQDLGLAQNILSGGTGQTTTGQTSSGGGLSGGITSLTDMLAFLYGKGAFGKSTTGVSSGLDTSSVGSVPYGGIPGGISLPYGSY